MRQARSTASTNDSDDTCILISMLNSYPAHSVFSVLFRNRRRKKKKKISSGSYLKLTEIHTRVHTNLRWEPDLISAQSNRSSSFSEFQEEDAVADIGTALFTPCLLGKEGKSDPNMSQAKAPQKNLEVSGVCCPH